MIAFERALLDELAAKLGKPAWDVFERFDTICDAVAGAAPDRLARSRVEA